MAQRNAARVADAKAAGMLDHRDTHSGEFIKADLLRKAREIGIAGGRR